MTPKSIISIALLSIHLLVVPCFSSENNDLSRIALANDLALKANYDEALAIYEELTSEGFENSFLFYNMANIYYRLGKVGNAILFYSKAKHLAPRDENLDANFRYVISKTEDQIFSAPTPMINQILFWIDDFEFWELVKGLIVVNALFWIVLLINFWTKSELIDYLKKGTAIVLVGMIASVGAKLYNQKNYSTGITIAKQIEIKSGQGNSNVTLFKLHEGAPVRILREENGWYKIQLPDKKSGWALKKTISKV
jgi:hypothetical protein